MTYYKFYHYEPSLAAACIFAIIFGITTKWHLYLVLKHRTYYCIPVVIGGVFEIVGYAARAVSNREAPSLSLGPYVITTLLLLVAPPLFAASMYMLLGRIIISVDGESHSLIKTKWLTKLFVTSDVICFVLQLGGAGLMASSHSSTAATGSHLALTGLVLQIVIFGFFVVVALNFHRRMKAIPTEKSHNNTPLPWQRFMYILYITSGLILVRNIVRVAEFALGFEGYIILHEVFLYIFDAVPMAAVMIIFNLWYPSSFSNQGKGAKAGTRSLDPNDESSSVSCIEGGEKQKF